MTQRSRSARLDPSATRQVLHRAGGRPRTRAGAGASLRRLTRAWKPLTPRGAGQRPTRTEHWLRLGACDGDRMVGVAGDGRAAPLDNLHTIYAEVDRAARAPPARASARSCSPTSSARAVALGRKPGRLGEAYATTGVETVPGAGFAAATATRGHRGRLQGRRAGHAAPPAWRGSRRASAPTHRRLPHRRAGDDRTPDEHVDGATARPMNTIRQHGPDRRPRPSRTTSGRPSACASTRSAASVERPLGRTAPPRWRPTATSRATASLIVSTRHAAPGCQGVTLVLPEHRGHSARPGA